MAKHRAAVRSCASCLLLLVATVNGQAQGDTNFVKYHKSPKVCVIPKLVYAKYGARQLYLDLYLPLPLEQNRPSAVVVRGGGWLVGDRKRFAHVASALAERGVAAACIEYRTADKDAFPAAIQDVKAAVRWMRANASKYGIDPEVVGTIGGSSGAHMALLVGLTQGMPEFEGSGGNVGTSSAVQGVVAMAVPADLLNLTENNKSAVAKFLHAMPEQNEEKWRLASPVYHIRSDGPPVLLLHGSDDDSVPTTQATDFAQRYRAAGARADVYILDGAPHAFWNYYPWFTEAMERAARFFVQLENEKKAVPSSPQVPSTSAH